MEKPLRRVDVQQKWEAHKPRRRDRRAPSHCGCIYIQNETSGATTGLVVNLLISWFSRNRRRTTFLRCANMCLAPRVECRGGGPSGAVHFLSFPTRCLFCVGATNCLTITRKYVGLKWSRHIRTSRVSPRRHGDNQIQRSVLVWNPDKPHKYIRLRRLMARDTLNEESLRDPKMSKSRLGGARESASKVTDNLQRSR